VSPWSFILIEMLVVVLITGILAAIALPQYQKAVDRARIQEALSNLQSIANAEEAYYLTTGSYTNDFRKLDIKFSCPDSAPGEHYGTCETANFQYVLYTDPTRGWSTEFKTGKLAHKFRIIFYPQHIPGSNAGLHKCSAFPGDTIDSEEPRFCQKLSSKSVPDDTVSGGQYWLNRNP
jgi:type II secretory pathway pseudopilin PulG